LKQFAKILLCWRHSGFSAISAPLIVALAYGGACVAGLRREDVITGVFAGSEKTIAMGIPLIAACPAGQPEVLGIVVLPIVFSHPWQLLTCAIARGTFLCRASNGAPASPGVLRERHRGGVAATLS
jgi:predicted Na+-dependent transporter